MNATIKRTGWGILHQATITIALVLFPVALVTERLGIPLGALMRIAVKKTTTGYENTV